jgi:hypothetical protein
VAGFAVATYTGTTSRAGSITIAGQRVSITQSR